MSRRGAALGLPVGLLAVVGGVVGARAHMLTMSGRSDLEGVSGCWTCHSVQTSDLRWAKERPRHATAAGLAVSPDGRRLFAALDERDEVVEIDAAEKRVLRRASVAGGPTGLALDGSATTLFVSCRGADRVAILDLSTFSEKGSAGVGLGPVGVAFVPGDGGGRLVVANSLSDDLSVLSAEPLAEVGRLSAGREPYAVVNGGDGRALVVARMSGIVRGDEVPAAEVTVVDVPTARVVRRDRLESAHLPEAGALAGDDRTALVPIVRVRNLVPITQVAQGWVMSAGLALCDPSTGTVVEMPLDDANRYYADPSGIAVDAAGQRAYVASSGGDVVTVVDIGRLRGWLDRATAAGRRDAIDDLELAGEYVVARIPTGRNPRQVALSPDGRTLFVAERLQDSILAVDTGTLRPAGRIELAAPGSGPGDDPVRRGERVFARATTTFQSGFSCRSCHPDGHVDGLTYDFDIDGIGRDVLDNRSLQGVAGTAPFKWNGKNPSLQVQCGPRFAKVLTRAAPFPADDLEDLAAFIESLPPTRTRQAGPLTPAQERGRALFFATRTTDGREIPRGLRCSTCHRPPLYTNTLSYDVGSKGLADSTGVFDTPQLLGIAASAPFMHDGRAATLEEIWTVYNARDSHGITNYMTKHQLNDLIEFLKTL